MQEFAIEKNVPCLQISNWRKAQTKYPFSTMDLNDYFAVGASAMAVRAARAAWYRNNPASPVKFSVFKTPEGYGCWRVA